MLIASSIDDNVIPLTPPTPLRRYSTKRYASKLARLGVDPGASSSQTVTFTQPARADEIETNNLIAYPSEVRIGDRDLSDSEKVSRLDLPASSDESFFGGKLFFPAVTPTEEVVTDLSQVDPLEAVTPTWVGARPISPLRDRDIRALAGFFEREDATDIEADVNQILSRLHPEPCWDEHEFDFLGDYV